ncbi:MAG: bifunctional DNA primase/polymerase, partial [Acidimicrobiia bacterium]
GNRARFVAGCDWRGAGGYVVAPPSIHPNGRPYQWLEGYGPGFPTLAAPAWLLEALRRPEAPTLPPERRPSPPDGYVRAALEREAGAVLAAPAGQRNDRLNRAAYNLGQLVGAGHIDAPAVVDALVRAALAAGLEERETERTIVSGLKSGMRHPRAIR